MPVVTNCAFLSKKKGAICDRDGYISALVFLIYKPELLAWNWQVPKKSAF
jgi:hypothetical protein